MVLASAQQDISQQFFLLPAQERFNDDTSLKRNNFNGRFER